MQAPPCGPISRVTHGPTGLQMPENGLPGIGTIERGRCRPRRSHFPTRIPWPARGRLKVGAADGTRLGDWIRLRCRSRDVLGRRGGGQRLPAGWTCAANSARWTAYRGALESPRSLVSTLPRRLGPQSQNVMQLRPPCWDHRAATWGGGPPPAAASLSLAAKDFVRSGKLIELPFDAAGPCSRNPPSIRPRTGAARAARS